MHEMAKNAINFTFCSVNKSSEYILEFGRDVLCGWGCGGVGLVSINVPSFTICVALTRSHCLGVAFSFRHEKDLSRTVILLFPLRN